MDDWARPRRYKIGDQIEKWLKLMENWNKPNTKMVQAKYKNGAANTKMAQAIFLPGAWGKIPVFMGKNHPTPRAAMAFLHAKNYPPFLHVEKIF